jgi:DNA replicative helicase MCM subunit Mcm2 (Cdc46/Mcm family)
MKLIRRLSTPDAALQMALYQCEQCRHTMTRSVEDDER